MMKKYSVHVCRIGYGHNDIVVEAAIEVWLNKLKEAA
jgi:hypothetical protein